MPDEHGLPLHDPEYEYGSTFHWRSLVKGYSGNIPASYIAPLRAVHPFLNDARLQRLRAAGVTYILVHERWFGRDAYRGVTAALDRHAALRRHGPFRQNGDASAIYEFTPAAHE